MKFLLFVFLLAFSDATPGYSGSSYSGNDIGHESSEGNSYNYAGSASGSGFPPGNFPTFVPFFPQFDFSSFFEQLNKQHQEFIKHSQGGFGGNTGGAGASSGGAAGGYGGTYGGNTGEAGASSGGAAGGYGGGYGLGNRGGFVGGYGGGFSGPDGNSYSFSGPIGNDGAFASGSIGPGGSHQVASVYPENPSSPNVNTRFGGGSSGGDGGGFKSVFTSSKSVTNNVDGKPQTFRQASTTINDNGKVTTYTAHNP